MPVTDSEGTVLCEDCDGYGAALDECGRPTNKTCSRCGGDGFLMEEQTDD